MLLRPKSPLNQRVIKSPLNDGLGRKNGTKKKLCPLGAPADLKSADKKRLPRFTAKQPY